jgi:alkanesulfonate monooxygenase SsuD/methylene tetrahydromethanopterin reductase-like flavin-dependent oxidoreductase (luciferase family)
MRRTGVAWGGGLRTRDSVECVKLAEDLGYESAWSAEGYGGDQFALARAVHNAMPSREPWRLYGHVPHRTGRQAGHPCLLHEALASTHQRNAAL